MITPDDLFLDSGAWGLFRLHVLKKGKKASTGSKPLYRPVPKRIVRPMLSDEELQRKTEWKKPPDYLTPKNARGLQFPDKLDFQFFNLRKGSDFRKYCDQYAKFIQEHPKIRLYANVDVIGNPKLTLESQHYLEQEHGLKPIPVIHRGDPPLTLKCVDQYLEEGHDLIGLGGFASGVGGWKEMQSWCDKVFLRLCPESNGYRPLVRVHGFAMTGWRGFCRWPWWSVDSTSWLVWPVNGWLPVPPWKEDRHRYDIRPHVLNVCPGSKSQRLPGRHFTFSKATRLEMERWAEYLGLSVDQLGEDTGLRKYATLKYYEELRLSLPKWPWPIGEDVQFSHSSFYKGAGLVHNLVPDNREMNLETYPEYKPTRLRIYYSGGPSLGDVPEERLHEFPLRVLLSYYELNETGFKRSTRECFDAFLKNRKKK